MHLYGAYLHTNNIASDGYYTVKAILYTNYFFFIIISKSRNHFLCINSKVVFVCEFCGVQFLVNFTLHCRYYEAQVDLYIYIRHQMNLIQAKQ